uniref:Globin domain-containing protein n=1 Tax=Meloidogyne enterolobii TaxID=390850 RepID=A0A6V7WK00_MELEN|nr:unnamed protein product [Meloidogyne enterolobii]
MSTVNPQQQNNNNNNVNTPKNDNNPNNNTNNNTSSSSSIFSSCCGIFCKKAKQHSATVRATNAWSNTKGGEKIEEKEEKAVNEEKAMSSSNKPDTEMVITTEPQKQQNGAVNNEKENETAATNEQELIFRREDDWTEEEISKWRPNEYERNLVNLTWSDDFDFLYELGTTIYTYIFDHNPQAKLLFIKIHRHGDEWRQSADFRTQALKFVQTISYAAKNLYHMEDCLQMRLFEIGENHVKYASRGFKPEYWDIFLDAMEYALTNHIASTPTLNAQERADATRVWRQLAHYIIVHMKYGYLAKEIQNTKEGVKTSVSETSSIKHSQSDAIL